MSDGDVRVSTEQAHNADDAWSQSLREVMRNILESLPDHATLGELVDAAKKNPQIAPVLDIFTVQELIEAARARPRSAPRRADPAEADGPDDGGATVIRRRADAPDGDLRILRALSQHGLLRESELATHATLTSDQVRILLRQLRTKGFIHIEGGGTKRRYRITRHGSSFLRKQDKGRARAS